MYISGQRNNIKIFRGHYINICTDIKFILTKKDNSIMFVVSEHVKSYQVTYVIMQSHQIYNI